MVGHQIRPSNQFFLCHDRVMAAFAHLTSPLIDGRHDAELVLNSLNTNEIVAIAGHLIGYSIVWGSSVFNQWV